MAVFTPLEHRLSRGAIVWAGGALFPLALIVGLSLGASPTLAVSPGQNGRLACDGERGTAPGPPSGGFPAFVTPRSEIYTMRADGSDVVRLTNNAVGDVDPTYSPDGTRLAFSSARSSSAIALHTMNPDGTDVQRVLFTAGSSFSASWSPDGANIAVMEGAMGFNVSRVNANGTDFRRLTMDPAIDGLPSWSPDGAKIAFDSTRSGMFRFEVYTMSAEQGEATNLQRLTTAPNSFSAQWAPDGARLTFLSDRDGNAEIYSMRADGSDVRRLTATETDNSATNIDESEELDPSYSPDGTKIVFASARSGDYEVYTMNAADGTGVTRLTNSPGFDGRCEWQAVRPAVTPPMYPTPDPRPTPTPTPTAKLKTSLTLKASPKRDRRLPFRYTFSGRVRIPAGVSKAAVCGGRVRLSLKKGSKAVARGSAKVSKRCTYKRRIAIKTTKRTGRKRGRLKVSARFGGSSRLTSSRKSTRVRFF